MKVSLLIIVLSLSIFTGMALADSAVPQTEETQGFLTSTIMQAVGTATETDSLSWQITNDGVNDFFGGLNPPLFAYDAAIYSLAYSEDTIADQGLVTYAKEGSVDTQGQALGQWNLDMEKVVEFVGLDTGRMISAEEQTLDGAGTPFFTPETFICPFAAEQTLLLPAFCNIVQEGSSVDLTIGSLSTLADTRFVTPLASHAGLDLIELPGWDLPVSDNGVESDYQVKLTGFGDIPAMGSADAYINVHVQEGRGLGFVFDGAGLGNELEQNGFHFFDPKAEDLTYSEDSTASGEITLFQKSMSYNSKLTGGAGSEGLIAIPLRGPF
ncbi:hypothetical protein J2741_002517 [Methanolinea mesophila]|uniref:hypothetical protein n=1 Tax=Methanolinea mesophila TaxID=547055 RepID=UPI001AE48BDB|nr:hypothetical protein [Methanolinea mesophila]MBP1929921.1 hypothetical protein [Methanolinea mesophila]